MLEAWNGQAAAAVVAPSAAVASFWCARLGALVLAAATAHRYIAERSAGGPVPAAALAEVPRLRQAVVVIVTKLRVERLAARTRDDLIRGFQPALLKRPLREQLARLLFLLLLLRFLLLLLLLMAGTTGNHIPIST